MHNDPAVSLSLGMAGDYEAELVAGAKERSPQAWDEIYARHYLQIYRYIHARVFDPHVAEDLAQTTRLQDGLPTDPGHGYLRSRSLRPSGSQPRRVGRSRPAHVR